MSDEFLRCIRKKIELIVQSIQDNRNEWIIWSDVDILFFDGLGQALQNVIGQANGKMLFFQKETKSDGEVNTGFILIQCCETTERFFREVGQRLEVERDKNEQAIENIMLQEGVIDCWGYLPVNFVARTHGWPPLRHKMIYHANYTVGSDGVGQKIRQFKAIRSMDRFGFPAICYFVFLRSLEKLSGLVKFKN
ncbi:MAG: hypothetical protein H8M99_13250 [Gloeobacteraceae cyanobacterium ES-bin-144]|nr:hypothetical protein [Verrucomicrobiales bacterium]